MPYTLLLADDSVTIQRVIELTFADEDVTVIAVSDGDQAIARLESAPPDIVLADIGMPGKNGYEVAQYIRRSTRLAHIPVVLLTGAFEPVDQARADEAGCDGVLAKPFEPQMVIGRVKELLARARPTADLPVAAVDRAAAADFAAPPPAPVATQDTHHSWASPPPQPSVAESNSDPAPPREISDYFDRLDAAFSTPSPNEPAQPPVAAVPDPEPTGRETGLEADLDWFGSRAEETGAATPWDLPAPPLEALAPPAEPETLAAVTATDQTPDPTPEAPTPEGPAVDAAESMVEAKLWMVEAAPMAEVEPMVEAAPVAGAAPIAPPDERLAPIEESAPIDESAPIEPPAAVAAAVAPVAPPVSAPPALELPLPNPPPLPTLPDAFAALLAAEQSETLSPEASLWPAAATLQAPPPAAISEELIEDVTRRVLDRLSDTVVRDAVAGIASTIAERLVREEIERIKASIK